MSNKDIEKELEQVSGGKIDVKSRIAMFEGLNQPETNPTGPTPGKINIGERSISYNDAHSYVANSRDKFGRPVAGR